MKKCYLALAVFGSTLALSVEAAGPRLVAHHDTYILLAKYNPNPPSLSEYSSVFATKDGSDGQRLDNLEAEFQISGKLIVAEGMLANRDYLSFAYTQQSFWQVYNKPFSSPFRDTNYEPELIYTWRPSEFAISQNKLHFRAVSIGYSHKANGSYDEFDRSWDRIYAQLDANYDSWLFRVKPWLPVGPEINAGESFTDYYGYGEVSVAYLFGDDQCNHAIKAMGRNNLKSDNKGAIDLRFSYCMSPTISLYAKYFNGYGESMIDYNIHNQSFGLGVSLNRIGDRREMASQSSKWTFAGMSIFRDNYILPVKYNPSPAAPDLAGGLTGDTPEKVELEFQLSFRLTFPFTLFTSSDNLSFAYSQQTFWQPYGRDGDAIRETNYEPELFYQWNAQQQQQDSSVWLPEWVRFGFVHESNGQTQIRSRSWNRIYTELSFDAKPVTIGIKPWYRLKEDASEDDNPNIEDYYGYGELTANWQINDNHRLSLMARNNLKTDNKGAIDVRWAYPITKELALYLKYFNGYGESLIDYNKHNQSLGIGFALNN
ncbi:phospholipase A [Agarivorans sp. TSD2052]|uniref:phospholipase A n=1 Tax=Agarivorans sp. TSD2052 TaxID=2937286 RepID=UPI0020106793|nr:phospholipase A [Agarivorans sp. TSD2052]UPW20389.1 phospholipase A [Agarivorans sp. TSD2052]